MGRKDNERAKTTYIHLSGTPRPPGRIVRPSRLIELGNPSWGRSLINKATMEGRCDFLKLTEIVCT